MRFFLISDNRDTLLGLRFAGIKGKLAKTEVEVKDIINNVDEQVLVIVITEKLADKMRDWINNFKISRSKPLIVAIPDRHGSGAMGKLLIEYIREAIW
ncbi:MAG: V-type ATP synthase subunit F [Candidatus Improbicoccus pseudotrichonymphae]|uniref:V-type ATP synthase subunit F n=1 Tax=Candidatus Improbicoccus pseudotrichonymphae TaxID=3033792 RepID=A0AA48HUY9_9FIRM|nr:MAG: V-type ATP synthase subunit F [Candidatus Improbicoccus pseudotrichonymphae]